MYFIRTTKTASLATAVQIVRYEKRRKIVVKHIGSAHTPDELLSLKQAALKWIEKVTKQQSLFPLEKKQQQLLPIDKCQYLGFRYTLIDEVINNIFRLFKFNVLHERLLLDLVLMRIVEPASKLQSLQLLSGFFGRIYQRADLYRCIPGFVLLKDSIEKKIMTFAKNTLNFNFSMVFYDVTTLYFETFTEDTLRKNGFSKDNKPNQPQILIGLVVNQEGFPVSYEVFTGNTFEGKTILPTICNFKKKYHIEHLTVVADAAMISLENIVKLVEQDLSYIVGARLGNIPLHLRKEIGQELKQIDCSSLRRATNYGFLVCDFSIKRYKKDRREMEKQIAKAARLIEEKTDGKRTKFIKNKGKTAYELNTALIEKTTLLLGVKGYYTNLADQDNQTIIRQYHNLWHVEKSFRIAKSDLKIRPVYHFKEHTVRAHILICFMALAVSKYMEIRTGKSIKKMVELLKSVTDARLKNLLTNEEIILRSEVNEELQLLLKTL